MISIVARLDQVLIGSLALFRCIVYLAHQIGLLDLFTFLCSGGIIVE
jgi:hypothetical protein